MIQSIHIEIKVDKMPTILEKMFKTKDKQIQDMKERWNKKQEALNHIN